MKQFFFVLLAIFLSVNSAFSQASFGLKAGLGTTVGKPTDLNFNEADSNYVFGIEKANFGFHLGIWTQFGTKVFIRPELYFNTSSTDYKLKINDLSDVVKNEKFQYVDLPVLVGFKIGPARINAGPVAHYVISSMSELTEFSDYKQKFKDFTWGYQAGIGVGMNKWSVDLRYEGNFSNSDNKYEFFGDDYNFATAPPRLFLSLNYKLF